MVGCAGACVEDWAPGFAGEGGRSECFPFKEVVEGFFATAEDCGKGCGAANLVSSFETLFWLGFFWWAGRVVFSFEESSRAASWRAIDPTEVMSKTGSGNVKVCIAKALLEVQPVGISRSR